MWRWNQLPIVPSTVLYHLHNRSGGPCYRHREKKVLSHLNSYYWNNCRPPTGEHMEDILLFRLTLLCNVNIATCSFPIIFVQLSLSDKCKEVGTTIVLCQLIRIITYYLVHVLFGTAIPTSFINLFQLFFCCCCFFYTCFNFYSATNLVEPLSKLLSASARLPGQACHIPSTNHATLYPAKMGCSALVFSNSGRLLAAGCASNDTSYPVIVFEVCVGYNNIFIQEHVHYSLTLPIWYKYP